MTSTDLSTVLVGLLLFGAPTVAYVVHRLCKSRERVAAYRVDAERFAAQRAYSEAQTASSQPAVGGRHATNIIPAQRMR